MYRQQGGGIDWVGNSSYGKSTSVEVAATRNETCLILDEIDEASPHEIGKIAYMLANGQGKQRAGRVGTARKIQRWRIITISTGERTLTSIMNEIGKHPNAGQVYGYLASP